MKNLINYLKTLWSWVSGSQRKKIGVTLGEATIEHPFSTYSAPFGTCWQPSGKLHSVVRCAAMLVMLFTIGSGNVWGLSTTVNTTSGTSWTVDGRTWTAATDVSAAGSYLAMKSNDSQITVGSTIPMDLSGTNTVTITVGAGYYGGKAASVTAKLTDASGTTISNTGTAQPTSNGNSTYTITLTPTNRTVAAVKVVIGVSGATKNSKYIRLYSFQVTYTGSTKYTVTFDKEGGDCSTASLTEASAGAGVTLPSASPSSTCASADPAWTFAGWAVATCANTTTRPTLYAAGSNYKPTSNITLHAVYCDGIGGSYTLNYDPDVKDETLAYGSPVDITAADGSEWVVKAYKNSGMQINTGKNASIKIPTCPMNITSINITGGQAKAVGLSASDYTGSGTTITYIVEGSDATSQTLDFTGKSATGGYIVPKSGSIAITQIVVNYGAASVHYNSNPVCESCDKSLTIAAGTPSNGTFTLSRTGSIESCSSQSITVTPSPAAGYQVGEVTATTPSVGGAPTITDNGNGTWTVTYAANSTGSSTINVSFETLVINILLTSYNNGHIQSCVEEGSATVNYNGTALNEFEPPIRSGFGSTPGYWTAPSGGVKVLDADGSFAATDVTGVIVNNHWTNTDNPFTLYARFTCNDTIFVTAASSGNGTTTLNRSYVATCDCEGLARQVTITATPNSGYLATSIAYSGDGNPTKVSGPTTSAGVTTWVYQYPQSDDGNGTFTVTYAAIPDYTVTWNVNGNASVTSSVKSGNKPTFPSTPASCDDESTTFVGWATAPWSGKIADLTGKTVYTSADDMPAVEGPVTYYAVWANGGGGSAWSLVESLSGLETGDTLVIESGNYALPNAETDAAPVVNSTYALTISDKKITSSVTNAMKWRITIESGTYPYTLKSTAGDYYLRINSDNNGVRINSISMNLNIVENSSAPDFAITSSNERYCAATSSYGWRSYTSLSSSNYLNSGKVHFYKKGGGNTDYVTTCCTEVEEPSVTVERHATYAVLSWPHQTNAVSYSVTCSGGSVSSITGSDTRSCTITGLTSETAYTYTVTAAGSSCSQTAAGGFTTANCDDVPVINSAVATTTTITFNWTCTSNNSTIYVYSDENYLREVRRKATTFTTTAKTDTIAGLESGVTYYYKILSDNTCASEGGSVATIESKITIAEWDTCGVTLDLGDIAGAIAIVENQNTQATVQQKYAKGLFFSKYFEAYQNVKLWAVYNGTEEKISLANVKVLVGSNGNGWGYSGTTPNATAAKTELSGYGHIETGWIYPGEEIIVYNSGNTASDASIMSCATSENANFSDWYNKTNNTTAFSGDDGLILIQGTDTIDVIGGMNIATAYANTVQKDWNDNKGWWCEDGEDMDGNSIELSTNRCLLVRKNTVEDGTHAVETNTDDFYTLCDEWIGAQVPDNDNAVQSSCLAFTYVGNYNYNEYYAKYDTIQKNIELDDIRQDDGTYFIKISQLDTMSCTNLRIVVTTLEGEKLTGTWKIPIFVTNDQATVYTNDDVFMDEGDDAATCDVVVLRHANLQVVSGGKNTIRNIEIYHTGKLDVPTGKTFEINSLVMRCKDDSVARADVNGTLTPTVKTIYLDKRITATRVYKFSLPYACNIADVKWRSGEKAVYGTDWILRWYDGDRRANGIQSGNWKLFTGSTIQPGVGYDLVINSDVLESNNKYAELRFPMAIGGDNVTSPATVSVPVKAYGANNSRTKDGQPVTPNHLGWNLIGNPYLNDYTKNHMPDDLTEGALSIVDDKYTLTKNNLRYLVVPTYAGSTVYQQVNMAITDMEPFTAYFVQIDGSTDNEALNVVFSLSNVAGRNAVRRRVEAQEYEDDNHIVWYAIDMSNEGGKKDETTLLISNRFNDKFEMMDDMHKIRNAGQSIIATRNDDGEMVFNALPDSSAAVKGVPVHYYAAEAGDYTISTSANYSLEEVAEAWLFDKTTGQYTNLLTDNYRFATAAGNNTDRFTLFVRVERKKAPEVATGNDNILTDGQLSLTAIDRTLVLSGLTENADVYVYDMSGKLLRGERANGNGIWRANVPAQGVYFVRVNGISGQQTLRTIVK